MRIVILTGSKAGCRRWVHLHKPASKCRMVCPQIGVLQKSQHLGWPAIQPLSAYCLLRRGWRCNLATHCLHLYGLEEPCAHAAAPACSYGAGKHSAGADVDGAPVPMEEVEENGVEDDEDGDFGFHTMVRP